MYLFHENTAAAERRRGGTDMILSFLHETYFDTIDLSYFDLFSK